MILHKGSVTNSSLELKTSSFAVETLQILFCSVQTSVTLFSMSWILSWCCCCQAPFNKKISGGYFSANSKAATYFRGIQEHGDLSCLLWETHFSKPTLQTHCIPLGVYHICTSAEEPSSNSNCSGCRVCGPVVEGWNRHDDPTKCKFTANICQAARKSARPATTNIQRKRKLQEDCWPWVPCTLQLLRKM